MKKGNREPNFFSLPLAIAEFITKIGVEGENCQFVIPKIHLARMTHRCPYSDLSILSQLTFEQYPLLIAGIEQARAVASDQDRAEIIERQNEVYRLWAERCEDEDGANAI